MPKLPSATTLVSKEVGNTTPTLKVAQKIATETQSEMLGRLLKAKSPLRVLQVLAGSRGPMSRVDIARNVDCVLANGRVPSETNTYHLVVATKLVKEQSFDLDGVVEMTYRITDAGKVFYEQHKGFIK